MRPTSPPGSSRASPSRPAARAPRWPSSRAPSRSSPAIVGAGLVAVLLLFLNSLLADLPQSALAGVVIAAALSLMNLAALRKYWQRAAVVAPPVDRGDARRRRARRARGHRRRDLPRGADVLPAQLVAARRGARPHRRQRGLAQRRRPPRAREETRASSCTAGRHRSSSPTRARSARQIRRSCTTRQPRWIVLQCEAITDIDVTAAEVLEQLDGELNAGGHPPGVRRDAQPAPGAGRHATASTTRSTATTSTTPSTPPSPPSATRTKRRRPIPTAD